MKRNLVAFAALMGALGFGVSSAAAVTIPLSSPAAITDFKLQ
jgi:hypothetical protein